MFSGPPSSMFYDNNIITNYAKKYTDTCGGGIGNSIALLTIAAQLEKNIMENPKFVMNFIIFVLFGSYLMIFDQYKFWFSIINVVWYVQNVEPKSKAGIYKSFT